MELSETLRQSQPKPFAGERFPRKRVNQRGARDLRSAHCPCSRHLFLRRSSSPCSGTTVIKLKKVSCQISDRGFLRSYLPTQPSPTIADQGKPHQVQRKTFPHFPAETKRRHYPSLPRKSVGTSRASVTNYSSDRGDSSHPSSSSAASVQCVVLPSASHR